MKFISWNVNGLRACVKKGFLDFFWQEEADFFCIQETKMQVGQLELELPGYFQYFNDAIKKGYSGTAIFTRHLPLKVSYGIEKEHHDLEGRVITLEYDTFCLVCVYTPNSKRDLSRLEYRQTWEDDFKEYLLSLPKPVILCGDLNVAHQEIDLKNPSTNHRNAGFTNEEREKMTELLASGFCDSYRSLYPNQRDAYTWWSYMAGARERNVGWRIDYFICSNALKPLIEEASIYADVLGSDHCPVGIIFNDSLGK